MKILGRCVVSEAPLPSTDTMSKVLVCMSCIPPFLGGDAPVSMGDVLSFFTGCTRLPPMGFGPSQCHLNFSSSNIYPTASTCALILTLPTLYCQSYTEFKEKMCFAFTNHGGFGLC